MKKILLALLSLSIFSHASMATDWDPFQVNVTPYYIFMGIDSTYACGEWSVPSYNPTAIYAPDSMRTDAPGFYTYFINVQNRTETIGNCLWAGFTDDGYEVQYTTIDSFVVKPNSWTVSYGDDSLYIEKNMAVGDSYSYPNGGFSSNVTVELVSETMEDFFGTSDEVRSYSITIDGNETNLFVTKNYGIFSGRTIYSLFRPSVSGTEYKTMAMRGMEIAGGATLGIVPSTDPLDYLSNIQPGMKRFWSVLQKQYDPYYGCFEFTNMYYDSIISVSSTNDWFIYEYLEQNDEDSQIDSICLNSFRGLLQNSFSGNHIGNICEYDSIMYHNYGWTDLDTMANDDGDTLTLHSYMTISQQNYVWDLNACTGDTTAALFPYQDKYSIYNNKFGIIEFGDTIYDQSQFSGNSIVYNLVGVMTENDTMGTTVGMGFFTPTSLNQYTGIYPNPVEVMFQVDIPFHHKPNPPYQIFDQTGRLVKAGRLDNLSMVMIPFLENGLYYIQVDFGDEKIVEKLVKH